MSHHNRRDVEPEPYRDRPIEGGENYLEVRSADQRKCWRGLFSFDGAGTYGAQDGAMRCG